MADHPNSTRTSQPPPGSAPPHKQALYEAVGDVIRKQAEERKAEKAAEAQRTRQGARRVSPIIVTGVAILISVGAYVAIEQPEWLFPKPLAAESREERDASLRMAMATTAQRIERYRQEHGRLPATLAAAGSTIEEITYEPNGTAVYTLRGRNGPVALTYRSSEPISAFVGSSFQVLAQRARR
jgi:hypothetical protein